MTKNEFYLKYKNIIEQNKLDTNEIVAVAFAIIQADKFLDEEKGNAKTLDLDDFVYTLNNDLMLKSILQTPIAIKPNLTKAKELYEVQLYRLLLDSVMLVMKDNVPKECGLLSPCALKVANLFKWKITKGGDVYATEEDCIKSLDLLYNSINSINSSNNEELFEFCQTMLEAYHFVNTEKAINLQPNLTNIVLGSKYKNYDFNVLVAESIENKEIYIRRVKEDFVQLLLSAFKDDFLLIKLFKIQRTPKNLFVKLLGIDISEELELKPVLNKHIKTIGDINDIDVFDKQQYFELLKIWFSINK